MNDDQMLLLKAADLLEKFSIHEPRPCGGCETATRLRALAAPSPQGPAPTPLHRATYATGQAGAACGEPAPSYRPWGTMDPSEVTCPKCLAVAAPTPRRPARSDLIDLHALIHEYGVREGLFHCTRDSHEVLGLVHDYRCDEMRRAISAAAEADRRLAPVQREALANDLGRAEAEIARLERWCLLLCSALPKGVFAELLLKHQDDEAKPCRDCHHAKAMHYEGTGLCQVEGILQPCECEGWRPPVGTGGTPCICFHEPHRHGPKNGCNVAVGPYGDDCPCKYDGRTPTQTDGAKGDE